MAIIINLILVNFQPQHVVMNFFNKLYPRLVTCSKIMTSIIIQNKIFKTSTMKI